MLPKAWNLYLFFSASTHAISNCLRFLLSDVILECFSSNLWTAGFSRLQFQIPATVPVHRAALSLASCLWISSYYTCLQQVFIRPSKLNPLGFPFLKHLAMRHAAHCMTHWSCGLTSRCILEWFLFFLSQLLLEYANSLVEKLVRAISSFSCLTDICLLLPNDSQPKSWMNRVLTYVYTLYVAFVVSLHRTCKLMHWCTRFGSNRIPARVSCFLWMERIT